MPAVARPFVRVLATRVLATLALASCPLAAALAQEGVERLVPPSPAPHGFIADGGPVLDAAAHARLHARIAAVQRTSGGDVGVAILRDLDGRAPSDVGVAIYRAWKIGTVDSLGSARRHLGALLLIVPKELSPSRRGECWITTGLGAEATLLDGDAGAICRDAVIPQLRERRYEAAVAAGVDAIGGAFTRAVAGSGPPAERTFQLGSDVESETVAAVPTPSERGSRKASPLILLLLLGGGAYGGLRGVAELRARFRRRPRPCPRGHGPMSRLVAEVEEAALTPGQRTEEQIDSVDYDVWACARCDERLLLPYAGTRRFTKCPACANKTLWRERRLLVEPTRLAGGLDEIRRTCAHCDWREVKQVATPALPMPLPPTGSSSSSSSSSSWSSSSSDSSSSGSSSSSSFGGDGGTSGGGGGSSY
jgi:uncharacterized protein